MSRSISLLKLALLVSVVAGSAACLVEERGPRGRTVVERGRYHEHGHGRGHAYGHEKHHGR